MSGNHLEDSRTEQGLQRPLGPRAHSEMSVEIPAYVSLRSLEDAIMTSTLTTSKRTALIAVMTSIALILGAVGLISAQAGPDPINLGMAADFVALGTAVTLTDSTVVGDVGSTGADPTITNSQVNGTVYPGGHSVVLAAYADFLDAYAEAAALTVGTVLSGDLDGEVLSPGVYSFDTTGKAGTLTLDAQGDPDAVWVLKSVAGGYLAATTFDVVIINGGTADNVFWWTDAAATLTDSSFQGTILSGAAVTVTGGTFHGRSLATDDVTMTGVDAGVPHDADEPEPFLPGRMTGGGSVFTAEGMRVTHGFTLQCDAADGPNNLQINWGQGRNGYRFHLGELDFAACSDDPAIDPAPPAAGFDTYRGTGTGRLNNQPGAAIQWTFTDAGQPSVNDMAAIRIWDAGGNLVLDVSGMLRNGNHQAHNK
ncbi:MAG: ice-binding family protein [Thermaerobacterales bacterium]